MARLVRHRWIRRLVSWRRDFHHVLPAEPMEIRATLRALRGFFGRTCDRDILDRTELVMAEILNNIAKHGGPSASSTRHQREVRIKVRRRADGMRCVVMDNGIRLPESCLQPPRLPSMDGDLPEGGFGLFIMRSLVARFRYTRQAERNLLMLFVPGDTGLDA